MQHTFVTSAQLVSANVGLGGDSLFTCGGALLPAFTSHFHALKRGKMILRKGGEGSVPVVCATYTFIGERPVD